MIIIISDDDQQQSQRLLTHANERLANAYEKAECFMTVAKKATDTIEIIDKIVNNTKLGNAQCRDNISRAIEIFLKAQEELLEKYKEHLAK